MKVKRITIGPHNNLSDDAAILDARRNKGANER